MRGKRSKQYRKLMQQYALTFHFREPYQVLVDAQMIQDTHRFKMDLSPALTRTLHGQVKPMITQCSIRHLFALPTTTSTAPSSDPSLITQSTKTALLEISRACTLRRCGHHTLSEPLSTLECHKSVIDPNDQGTNKHRLVLAVQDESVRRWARGVKGVPTIYVRKSVMIMEPMASASVWVKEREEKEKLRGGIRKVSSHVASKRKHDEEDEDEDEEGKEEDGAVPEVQKKKRKVFGTKDPNPLSMKIKKKSRSEGEIEHSGRSQPDESRTGDLTLPGNEALPDNVKKRRRRRHKAAVPEETGSSQSAPVAV